MAVSKSTNVRVVRDRKGVEQISETLLTSGNALNYDYENLAEAFPHVEPGTAPMGNIGLFQIRRPKKFTAAGIEVPAEARATEYYNTQVAKVISLGPLCFKTGRNIDGEEKIFDWPEGPWFKPGDFVRVPKYGGDRYSIRATVREMQKLIGGSKVPVDVTDDIVFSMFKVKDILGVITCDPRLIRAYLD